ncbi:CidA/LrgA family protein [Massilia sp. YIM B02763]|uniref:CidA/LrgA family protein n=1 Tax=Massilia sp. YIM B02763 TaxID=3050130 RepID=UPI0025B653C4|nr:CidA/LrgA family protein [Massilia sp. YIM B02763]MDN4053979.1 CidA/LrgA family protein [Massilia sp. YIM B02763]
MLPAFAILLLFQCLGEALVFLFRFPIPGPVAGMLLLLAALVAWPRLHDAVEQGANELLRHLSLLFVPAGVGIVVAASSVGGHWVAVAAGLVVSTLLTLAVTALVLKATSGTDRKEGGDV